VSRAFDEAFDFLAFDVDPSACACSVEFSVQTICDIAFSVQTAGVDDMAETFDIGDLVRSVATFSDSDSGAAIDPSTVAATLMLPDRTETSYTYGVDSDLTRASAGVYRLRFTPAASGTYRVRWVTTGTGQCAEEGWCQVRPRRVS
jgi:hypothetical protein